MPGNYRTHSLPFTPRLDGDLIVPVGTIGNAKFFIKVTVVDAAHPAGQVFLYPLTPTSGVNFSNPTNPNERATNITPDGYKWYTNSADLGTLYTGHVEGPYYLDIPGGSEAKTVTIATRAILTCNDNGDAGGNNVFYNGGFTVSGVAPNTSSPDLQVGPDGKYLPNGDYSDVNQNGNTGEDVNDTDGDGNTAEAVLVPAGIYSGLEMTEIPTNFADIAGGTTISEVTGSPTLRKLTVTPGKFPGTTFDIEQSTDFSSWSTLGTYAQSPTTPTEIEVSTS